MAFSNGAEGWSAVCDWGVLPDHTPLPFWKPGQQVALFDEEVRGGSFLNFLNIQYVW